MTVEIISIGDELLIGQVVNTNASWMAEELNKIGARVNRIVAISDNGDAIHDALNEAGERAEIILLTGGLGPTKDDITKQVLADYFGCKLIFHEPSFEQVKRIFKARNFEITPLNRKQAEVPDICTPLLNKNGTAPGMWFEKNNKVFVSMPGVPFEMKALMKEQVIPALQKKFSFGFIYHKTIMTHGVGESKLAEMIQHVEDELPDHIKLAYLPQPGIVRLRLTAYGDNKQKLEEEVKKYCLLIKNTILDLVFGFDDIGMEEVVGNLLREKNKTVSTAESCTGGYIAHLITSIAGSSDYFKGSIVSYSNEVKIKELGVSRSDLDQYGAVSRQVVEQMAIVVREKMKTEYSLATSGIAGPTGGTEEKPVGTVWIALASKKGVRSVLHHFGEHRGRNIRRAALAALNMLRLELIKNNF
jgi:competence/damage-inducible protein CinA-like protein